MYDLKLMMKAYEIEKEIQRGEWSGVHDARQKIFNKLEEFRSKSPVVFNIETTNACGNSCVFCPRTTKMYRAIATMSDETYEKVIDGLEPHSKRLMCDWIKFCEENYKIYPEDQNENAFYLYISSKCITLHGHGDPALDSKIAMRVKALTEKDIPSYFSMNPSNINLKKIQDVMESGLSYLKFSIDYDTVKVRGEHSKFSLDKLKAVKEMRDENGYKTQIVVATIAFSKEQENVLKEFLSSYKPFADYCYLKSQDNRWLYQASDAPEQMSLHWTTLCKMPWSSVSILSRGYVVPCHQIYNVECVLGDVNYESLQSVWDSEGYYRFRQAHFSLDKDIVDKCLNRCDMSLFGEKVDEV